MRHEIDNYTIEQQIVKAYTNNEKKGIITKGI